MRPLAFLLAVTFALVACDAFARSSRPYVQCDEFSYGERRVLGPNQFWDNRGNLWERDAWGGFRIVQWKSK